MFYPLLSLDCVNEICCCSVFSLRPASVVERLICHAIIGKNPHKERIMRVDVTANFIAPLTKFSTREISFTSYQVLAGILSIVLYRSIPVVLLTLHFLVTVHSSTTNGIMYTAHTKPLNIHWLLTPHHLTHAFTIH